MLLPLSATARACRAVVAVRLEDPELEWAAFRALHEGEPFVIPNPWDAGSAKVLAAARRT